jgi:indolepyruvate ferredoxin oxidoreductase beta subunit
MTLTPAPSYVDVMVASELLEAGRAMQNGFVTSDRTTLIASTHRIYTVAEKMQMGDGRFDSDVVLKAAQTLAKRAILFDMQAQANAAGTVISAVMFGALAGSGTLPLSRADCEAAVRSGGKGAEASLKGFDLGYAHAAGGKGTTPEEKKRLRGAPQERVQQTFPAQTHAILEEGAARCADFQNRAYADLYLDRLDPIAKLDHAADGYRLTIETGRFLALWMCYEDVIRVADLKTRRSRFERVREEVQAKPHEPVRITEFLKPGVDEFIAVLPRWLARPLRSWAERTGLANRLNVGLYVRTTSVSGFLLMRFLAWLRPLRPFTSRWHEERVLIDRWLAAIAEAAGRNPSLALEIALCGRLIKGYGETHKRGRGNFLRILDTLVEGGAVKDDRARIEAIRKARDAALADPEGRKLEQSLEAHGIAPLPPAPKPVKFMRKPKPENRRTA